VSQGQAGEIISPLLSGVLYVVVGWYLFQRTGTSTRA
jgi:hypothetical protein